MLATFGGSMRPSMIALALSLSVVPPALAQRLRGPEDVQWTTFVGGSGRSGDALPIDDSPGRIELPGSPWRCGYARSRDAQVGARDWSVQRVLACQRDGGTVSSTATCRVRNGVLDERAATLSLGTVGQTDYVTVTLGCRRR